MQHSYKSRCCFIGSSVFTNDFRHVWQMDDVTGGKGRRVIVSVAALVRWTFLKVVLLEWKQLYLQCLRVDHRMFHANLTF